MKIIQVSPNEIIKQTGVAKPRLFDYIVVADGSGTRMMTPCGWGGFIFDVNKGEREEFYGGFSGGTNNFAEMMPFVYALSKIDQPGRKVLLISDSEVVVKGGTGEYQRSANKVLWAAITSSSCEVSWLHIPRNSVPVHALADEISREIRFILEDYERRV